ncbi:hypothetical protein CIHG_00368 [Coccidioides immitis H538.4]|uniref:Uncharacterized protein n=3 Tax=Coccidioides immitis TaxID=5501 RepID=A0A0J8QHS4_COCIT|nr:hypothetical protein CIRG_07189 [Coccidioides immitis RMSCC 2394]KMU72041.1 hypothetical protein CISG_00350 [Coccidioides immitis RMSCC 3703]KMU82587.1 hypothetical protein CIHG_00368 [Coccidioides immitis H538.4]
MAVASGGYRSFVTIGHCQGYLDVVDGSLFYISDIYSDAHQWAFWLSTSATFSSWTICRENIGYSTGRAAGSRTVISTNLPWPHSYNSDIGLRFETVMYC